MKKLFVIAMTILILISSSLTINANNAYSWYIKRKSNNLRPDIPSELSFIEDYDGYWIDNKCFDDSTKKNIYLTFDAGYENGNVEKVLNVLNEKEASGAFFVLSHFITANPQLINRMIKEGHTICNHTANHKDMSKIVDLDTFRIELEKLDNILYQQTGTRCAKIYRPPEGRFTRKNLEFAKFLGYKTVFWSVAYADWDNNAQPDPESAKKKILNNIHNGAVILLHPTSATNAAILGDLIDEIRNRGYEIKSIENLFN